MATTSAIGGVARSERTHLLELGGARQGTQLAVAAPASAPITATLRLGHQVPAAGGHLAQIGQHFGEAHAFAVIWRERQRDELTQKLMEGSGPQHPDRIWPLESPPAARCCKIPVNVTSQGASFTDSRTCSQTRRWYLESGGTVQKVWTVKRQLMLHWIQRLGAHLTQQNPQRSYKSSSTYRAYFNYKFVLFFLLKSYKIEPFIPQSNSVLGPVFHSNE